MYLAMSLARTGGETGEGAGVYDTMGVGLEVLLLLVGSAPEATSGSSSLLVGGEF